jgi:hypothetical protein
LSPQKAGDFAQSESSKSDIDNFAVAAAPSQGRLLILFESVEKYA